MKKTIMLFLVLFLSTIPYVLAQSSHCQYADIETYSENELMLTYDGSNVIGGKVPVFSNFINDSNRSSFMIFNPNDFKIVVMLNYTVDGHGGANRNYGIAVPPKDYVKAKENCYFDDIFGPCTIIPTTVNYYVLKPQIMYPEMVSVTKTREICDRLCTINSDCSGGICNIMNFCDTKKIVVCVNGKNNCNDESCSLPYSKPAGEAYQCDWECLSGSGTDGICKSDDGYACNKPTDCLSGECNIASMCGPFVRCPNGTQNCDNKLCIEPSNKSIGEAYSCAWECESGAGTDGICQTSLPTKARSFFLWASIIILITSIAFLISRFSIKHLGEKKIREEQERIKKEYENIFKMSEERIIGYENNLARLNRELKDEKQHTNLKKSELKNLNKEFEAKKEKVLELIAEQVAKQNSAIKHEHMQWEKIKPFPDEQAGLRLVVCNPYLGGYKCFYHEGVPYEQYKISWLLHRWVWKKYNGRWPRFGYHIHHKDGDKFNNSPENLEEIDGDEHFAIHRQPNHNL
jgi:hypothetical protein